MVLFPGQWHTYYPYVQTGWNEYYIGFEGAVIDDMVKGGFLSKENQVLEVGLNEEARFTFLSRFGNCGS